VVRQKQPGWADKGSRPAVIQTDAGQADMIQPLLRDREVIFVLHELGGRIVKRPHAFVCLKRSVENREGQGRPVSERECSLHRIMVARAKMGLL